MLSSRLALVLILAGLAACKKKEEPPPVAAAPPAPAPVAAVTTIELGRGLGPNKRVVDTTSIFATRDTFRLAVVTEHTAPGAQLSAKWTFQTGQVVDTTTQAVAAPSAGEPVSVTEFHLTKASRWPTGKYRVEVSLDGALKGSKEFEVRR